MAGFKTMEGRGVRARLDTRLLRLPGAHPILRRPCPVFDLHRCDTPSPEDHRRNWFGRAVVTWNLFPILRVNPVAGRHFLPEEERGGREIILISHGFWQRRFGASPDALGSYCSI